MTTVSQIIQRAYRENNFVALGDDPTDEELAEGLAVLQNIVDAMFPVVVGTEPAPWYVPSPQRSASVNAAHAFPRRPGGRYLQENRDVRFPAPNTRIMARNADDMTIYFQEQPQDGALMFYIDTGHDGTLTLDANGALFGLTGRETTVTIAAEPGGRNQPRQWVYREDYAAWVELETLVLGDDMPFPRAFEDYFVTELSMRLTPQGANEPRQITLLRNRDMKTYIRQKYLQMAEVWTALPGGRNASQTYGSPYGGSGADFSTGA